MSDTLLNSLPSKGSREEIQVDVDENGVLVLEENDQRSVAVMYNNGPNTAFAGKTLESSAPDVGIPVKAGGAIVDGDSYNAWYFTTDAGETADIRGWEVERP